MGLIDDYFPDYQFCCGAAHTPSQKSGESRFFCAVFGRWPYSIIRGIFEESEEMRNDSAVSVERRAETDFG